MRITNIQVTPVNIPLELPFLWTAGLYPGTSKAIIEVTTDEGITGLGEAPSAHLAHAIEALAPRLLGHDPSISLGWRASACHRGRSYRTPMIARR